MKIYRIMELLNREICNIAMHLMMLVIINNNNNIGQIYQLEFSNVILHILDKLVHIFAF